MQNHTQRLREWAYGYQGGRVGGGIVRQFGMDVHVCVLVAQSYLTLCDPMDCSPPGSSVHGILQGRIMEWLAIPFSRRSPQPRNQTWVSHIAGRFVNIWATREAHGHVHTPIFKRDNHKILLNSTEPSAQCFVAAWIGGVFVESGYAYMYFWTSSLFTWNYHNIVNWLYANIK